MDHIALSRWCDLILVAPTTAKEIQGVTDDSKLNVESLKKIVSEYKKICIVNYNNRILEL